MVKRAIYFSRRFYLLMIGVIFLFVLAYYWNWFMIIAESAFALVVILTLLDYFILFRDKHSIEAERILTDRFSNGDENKVELVVKNRYPFAVNLMIIDEIPEQFQKRDFKIKT